MPGAAVKRVLIASEEVNRLITGPWEDEKEELRSGRLWADFDRYVEGRLISLSLDNPYRKSKSTYAARLDPVREDVWEIRSRDPKPGIRVFGRFADVDVFVALTWDYRENLGGPYSKEFDRERERCKAEWRKLFNTYPTIFGSAVDEYISENAFLV